MDRRRRDRLHGGGSELRVQERRNAQEDGDRGGHECDDACDLRRSGPDGLHGGRRRAYRHEDGRDRGADPRLGVCGLHVDR